MSKLEKLQENWLIAQDFITFNQWNWSLWSQNWYIEKKYQFGNYVLWFLKVVKAHTPKF
jgi:hypothetical protein